MLAGAGLLCAMVVYGPIRFPAVWTGQIARSARRLSPGSE